MARTLFGYNPDGSPNYEDLQVLEQAQHYISSGASLRDVASFVSNEASRPISHEGLKRRLKQPIYKYGGSLLAQQQD